MTKILEFKRRKTDKSPDNVLEMRAPTLVVTQANRGFQLQVISPEEKFTKFYGYNQEEKLSLLWELRKWLEV